MEAKTMSKLEVDNLLAEFDAEFGKSKKVKAPGASGAAEVNRAFHKTHPQADIASGRAQLQRMKFDSYYDWSMHVQRLRDIDRAQAEGVPQLQWLPEAVVTFIIHQQCSCCKEVVTFIGNEYIRFRGRRRVWKTLEGKKRVTWPTILQRVSEVDGNLISYGLPNGEPLPDLVEELNETVRRCAGCISVERLALDLWTAATLPKEQLELDIEIPLLKDGR